MSENYHEETKRRLILRLRDLLMELPEFCFEYFRGIETTTSERTRCGYATDLKIFFHFLAENKRAFRDKAVQDLTLDDLNSIDVTDIERFLDYVTIYSSEDERELSNGEKGKARKVAAIRSIFKYFYRKQKIQANPASLIDTPKIHDKNIIRLDMDEMSRLMEEVESGQKLTKKQQEFHKVTRKRDVALISVLLGTGMRVSEFVGLNIGDIDHKNNGLKITRKGGNESVVYFGEEIRQALDDYLEERKTIIPATGHEEALFLSIQKKRISVRAVEDLVTKYASVVTTMKHITPHKLRSSYGTALYTETGDIYLVADVLGHKDVNTTKKHYAQMQDSRRRMAATAVTLRRDNTSPVQEAAAEEVSGLHEED